MEFIFLTVCFTFLQIEHYGKNAVSLVMENISAQVLNFVSSRMLVCIYCEIQGNILTVGRFGLLQDHLELMHFTSGKKELVIW